MADPSTDPETLRARAAEIAALAERCEKAEGPDRELDELIADALFERSHFAQLKDAPLGTGCMMWWQDGHQQSALRYTTSIDAAMTLVPEGKTWGVYYDPRLSRSYVGDQSGFNQIHTLASTPALALCAAALRAHFQGTTDD